MTEPVNFFGPAAVVVPAREPALRSRAGGGRPVSSVVAADRLHAPMRTKAVADE